MRSPQHQLAALAEIGGAWLVWQGVREHRCVGFGGAGIVSARTVATLAAVVAIAHAGTVVIATDALRARSRPSHQSPLDAGTPT